MALSGCIVKTVLCLWLTLVTCQQHQVNATTAAGVALTTVDAGNGNANGNETTAGGIAGLETTAGGIAGLETTAGGIAGLETTAGGIAGLETTPEGTAINAPTTASTSSGKETTPDDGSGDETTPDDGSGDETNDGSGDETTLGVVTGSTPTPTRRPTNATATTAVTPSSPIVVTVPGTTNKAPGEKDPDSPGKEGGSSAADVLRRNMIPIIIGVGAVVAILIGTGIGYKWHSRGEKQNRDTSSLTDINAEQQA